jgi:hypothetical protein
LPSCADIQRGARLGCARQGTTVPPEVKELVRVGKTLEALRRYREVTGASLEQAKAVVLSL